MHAAVVNGCVRTAGEGRGAVMGDTFRVYTAEGDPGCTQKWSESKMLEFTACGRRPNGRLSCQLPASPEVGGVVAHLMDTLI